MFIGSRTTPRHHHHRHSRCESDVIGGSDPFQAYRVRYVLNSDDCSNDMDCMVAPRRIAPGCDSFWTQTAEDGVWNLSNGMNNNLPFYPGGPGIGGSPFREDAKSCNAAYPDKANSSENIDYSVEWVCSPSDALLQTHCNFQSQRRNGSVVTIPELEGVGAPWYESKWKNPPFRDNIVVQTDSNQPME